jgi:hypothetical protein
MAPTAQAFVNLAAPSRIGALVERRYPVLSRPMSRMTRSHPSFASRFARPS